MSNKKIVSCKPVNTTATLSAESLENQLRGMKLDNSWNKTVETFLYTWSTRLHDLEHTRNETIPDEERRRWLIHSIKMNAQLYQSVTTARSVENSLKKQPGYSGMTWDQFYAMLLDQAMIIDSNQPSKRKANMQNQQRNQNNNQNGNPQQNGRGKQVHSDFIPYHRWIKMSPSERHKVIQKRQKNKTHQANQASTAPTAESTAPPATTVPTTPSSAQSVNNSEVTPPSLSQTQAQRFLAQADQQHPRTIVSCMASLTLPMLPGSSTAYMHQRPITTTH